MKYSAEEINDMSYLEWMETIANELNLAGFKTSGYSETARKFVKNINPYEVYDVKTFFLGSISDYKAMDYLKEIGLVNNKRCPMCGNPITGTPSTFTCGITPHLSFHICSSCRREGKRISINPANNSSCMLAIILMPWYKIKNAISHLS